MILASCVSQISIVMIYFQLCAEVCCYYAQEFTLSILSKFTVSNVFVDPTCAQAGMQENNLSRSIVVVLYNIK